VFHNTCFAIPQQLPYSSTGAELHNSRCGISQLLQHATTVATVFHGSCSIPQQQLLYFTTAAVFHSSSCDISLHYSTTLAMEFHS
jgi:hypothetical protein